MHCKYLFDVPYKSLEKFSKALYGTTGGTYSARIFRPVIALIRISAINLKFKHFVTLATPRVVSVR